MAISACDGTGRNSAGSPGNPMNTQMSLLSTVSSNSISTWNWMEAQNDAKKLTELSIPGTHDSGARYEPIGGTAKCQNLTIGEQLNAGIRFLDIRCRHIDNAFAIHHGSIYQNLNFDDVLNASFGFLNSHPTETIVMSVKEEYNSSNTTRSFEDTFMWYYQKNPGGWLLDSSVPALGQARGKIVLLRRFGANNLPKGIPASDWADNTTFSSGVLRVQDAYQVPDNNNKWNAITGLFNEARSGGADTLYINFTSGYKPGIFGIPDINAVANSINPRITDYFKAGSAGRYGIIPMDFADTYKSSLIIKTNIIENGTGVTFYQDTNYGGSSSQVLGAGRYDLALLISKGVPNDWASSCTIPAGWKVTVYQHDNFGGTAWDLYPDWAGGQSNFPGYAGLNDEMSSCVIESDAGVTFYQDTNYGGAASQPLTKGRYTLSQLISRGVQNDWASSCKIPLGWKVTIYQHDNFGGSSWTLYPDAAGGQANFPFYGGLNDAMSSCVIE